MSADVVASPSRLAGRAQVVARALIRRIADPVRRRAPEAPRRILIVHHLLLGDTLMLTPLLAKLRARFPKAEVVMALPDAFAPLYSGRPYGVRALGWNPRTPAASALWREPGYLATLPLGRLVKPEEIADAVHYLATEGSMYCGEVLSPNAGAVI